jgi:hypothetical protein
MNIFFTSFLPIAHSASKQFYGFSSNTILKGLLNLIFQWVFVWCSREKILKEVAPKLDFLFFLNLHLVKTKKSGPPNGQEPPSFIFYLMHNI